MHAIGSADETKSVLVASHMGEVKDESDCEEVGAPDDCLLHGQLKNSLIHCWYMSLKPKKFRTNHFLSIRNALP